MEFGLQSSEINHAMEVQFYKWGTAILTTILTCEIAIIIEQ